MDQIKDELSVIEEKIDELKCIDSDKDKIII